MTPEREVFWKYANELSDVLLHSKIGKYEIDMDPMAGSLFITVNDDMDVYCSPLWDGTVEGIDVVRSYGDGSYSCEVGTLPFVPTFDLETDKRVYLETMEKWIKENIA